MKIQSIFRDLVIQAFLIWVNFGDIRLFVTRHAKRDELGVI